VSLASILFAFIYGSLEFSMHSAKAPFGYKKLLANKKTYLFQFPKLILSILFVLTCGAGLFFLYDKKGPPSARSIADAALPKINQEISRQTSPFLLLLGDSNGEGLGKASFDCGVPIVNAAISGLKARDVKDQLARLDLRKPPAAALIVVGTNDLLWKHDPSGARDAWLKTIQSMVSDLRRHGAKVVVSAVAPIGSDLGRIFDIESVKLYSDGLSQMCAGAMCTFIDPWVDARSENFSQAKTDALPDGIHIGDYRYSIGKIERVFCARLQE
jgi:hypothetical protein